MGVLNFNSMIRIIVYEQRFRTEITSQPKIDFSLGGEKGGLCFNDLNTSK